MYTGNNATLRMALWTYTDHSAIYNIIIVCDIVPVWCGKLGIAEVCDFFPSTEFVTKTGRDMYTMSYVYENLT